MASICICLWITQLMLPDTTITGTITELTLAIIPQLRVVLQSYPCQLYHNYWWYYRVKPASYTTITGCITELTLSVIPQLLVILQS